jgi:hypothetical protein
MSIVPISHMSLQECQQLGNNTFAAVLRDRLLQHRPGYAPKRRWRFKPAPRPKRCL